VDFGLARINAKMDDPTQSTRNLSLKGSIYFMSPEQMHNKELDGRSDLYSLGCLFYYALCGKLPFPGDTAIQVMASHLNRNPDPLEKHRPDLPPWVCQWVMSLFHRNLSKRPASTLDALDEFLERNKRGY